MARRSRRSSRLILIVDDLDDNREMYAEYFAFIGYQTAEATTGLTAIESAQMLGPDVIVMDLSLPGMDGWEAMRRLKADATTSRIPIIVVTGHVLNGTEQSARDAGADVFLPKPCLPEELAAAVRRILARQKRVA